MFCAFDIPRDVNPTARVFSDLRVGTPPIAAKEFAGWADASSPADIFGAEKWQATITLCFQRATCAVASIYRPLLLQQGSIFQHHPNCLGSKAEAGTSVGPTNGLGFELSADFLTNRELPALGTSVACSFSN
jgi:hypothetical protein